MAQIRRVVYTDLPGQAGQVRGKGDELNKQLHVIFDSVNNMRKDWFGQRYNDLVMAFNGLVRDFNAIVELMYTTLPSTLETIANNYSRADRGMDITKVDNSLANKLVDIPLSTEVGMRFNTAEVEVVKQKCNSCFAEVLEFLNQSQTLITNLSWESEAGDKFREEFQKLKNRITTSIEQIKDQFDKSVVQTLADMQGTENANTVS